MRSLDKLRIDETDFLPEIIRGCGGKARTGIDVPRDLEHPGPDSRKDGLHDPHHAVVERVDGAGCFRFANAAGDEGLDVGRLDLDVHCRPRSDRGEHLSEGGNLRPVSQRESLELLHCETSDHAVSGTLRMSGVDDRIVVHYDYPVACRVHIELDSIGSELDGPLERGDRILGMALVRPAVGDALRGITAACGQAFLSVVAFCSMSAKDMSASLRGQSALTAGGLERLPDEAP